MNVPIAEEPREAQTQESTSTIKLVTANPNEELCRTWERRRKNLNRLLDGQFHGRTRELAKALQRSVPYMQRLLKASHLEAKTISEGVARDFEKRLALEFMWLDVEHADDEPNRSFAVSARRYLPVMGDMNRGRITMALEQAIHVVPSVSDDPDAYVLRSTDDSFFPRLWRDEGIVVEPSRHPLIDSMIIVKRRGNAKIELYRLIAEWADSIQVAKVVCILDSEQQELMITTKEIEYIHATNGIVDCRRLKRKPSTGLRGL
jgi:hypothetical protein